MTVPPAVEIRAVLRKPRAKLKTLSLWAWKQGMQYVETGLRWVDRVSSEDGLPFRSPCQAG